MSALQHHGGEALSDQEPEEREAGSGRLAGLIKSWDLHLLGTAAERLVITAWPALQHPLASAPNTVLADKGVLCAGCSIQLPPPKVLPAHGAPHPGYLTPTQGSHTCL